MADIEVFRNHIIEASVLDPEGIHHEFVSGMHGRKLDFDSIPEESQLFNEWTEVGAEAIDTEYPAHEYGSLVVLSVAGGTNRLVPYIAERLGKRATPLLTEKISAKAVRLTNAARQAIQKINPDIVIAFEDVGTQGTTSATAVVSAREAGAENVVAMNTWQRNEQLIKLDEVGARYTSIIYGPLKNFSPEECLTNGYCYDGWKFIEHEK